MVPTLFDLSPLDRQEKIFSPLDLQQLLRIPHSVLG